MITPEPLREQPPFSHSVKIAQISANPSNLRLEAGPDELLALARLWKVDVVYHLRAQLQVSRWKKDGIRVAGAVSAKVSQPCVVSLEPVDGLIEETIDHVLVPEGSRLAKKVAEESAEAVLDPDAPDAPDIFSGDTLDIGAIIAEFAALAIDPYPRKAGVAFAEHIEDDAAGDKRPSPFAALKDWKKD